MSKPAGAQREWNGGPPRVLDDFESGRRKRHADATRDRGGKRFIGRAEIERALLEFKAAGGVIHRQPEQIAPGHTFVARKYGAYLNFHEIAEGAEQ